MTERCANPIAESTLIDYWLAVLLESDEAAVEEHLFQCDRCGDRLRDWMELADGLRQLAREGSMRMVVSDRFLEHVAAEGRTVRQYGVAAGGSVECTVTAEDDFLIGRLAADLSGADRVDVSVCDPFGVERLRMIDIPVNRQTGSVIFQESITTAKAAPSNKMIFRLVSVDSSGSERQIGEYSFNHTRSIPGPAAWQL